MGCLKKLEVASITPFVWPIENGHFNLLKAKIKYRKVARSRLSRLVAHFWIFRLLMRGKFDAYVL